MNSPDTSRVSLRRVVTWGLLGVFYVAAPVAVWAFARGRPVLPLLWVAALVGLGLLWADPGFDRRRLVSWQGTRRYLPGILLRAGGLFLLGTVILSLSARSQLFDLPRTRPRLWLLLLVVYPLLSVVPQALLYRALFFQRFAALFPSRPVACVVSAAAFSLAHLVFGNIWALLLTFPGGLLLAWTYDRTRSLPLTCLEHALYGNICFTVGLGRYLYHGTQALLMPGG